MLEKMIDLIKKTTELNQNVLGVKERLEILETDIPSMAAIPEPKKKFSWGKLAAVLTLVLAIVGGGGFCGWYYIWRDVNPQRDYIQWEWRILNFWASGDDHDGPIDWTPRLRGRLPIKEGNNEFVRSFNGYDDFKLNCFVYKQDKTLSLQSIFVDEASDPSINSSTGPRVTTGCSTTKYQWNPFGPDPRTYEFECCWVSEED